ncbi:MAG: hypothetical protein RMX96_09625, partial [Nostoc sp. ChiSLP02]|nr:hypothetical protein [Nostoc sp. ChiSLP02]
LRLDVDLLRLDVDLLRLNIDLLRLDVDLLRLDVDLLRLNFDLLRLDVDLLRLDVDLLRFNCGNINTNLINDGNTSLGQDAIHRVSTNGLFVGVALLWDDFGICINHNPWVHVSTCPRVRLNHPLIQQRPFF